MQISSHAKEEAAFFVIGVLPYWFTLWLPDKSLVYWVVLVWACCVWIIYGIRKSAKMTVLNNVVEMAIAITGIWRLIKH